MVDLSPLINSLTSSITPSHIVNVLTSIIGVGMAFVLTWFGIRKLVSIFKKAVTHGSIGGLIEDYRDYKYYQRRNKQLEKDWGK